MSEEYKKAIIRMIENATAEERLWRIAWVFLKNLLS